MTQAAFIHSDELEQYRYPHDCPFKAERAGMLLNTLTSMGLINCCDHKIVAPTAASDAELGRFHTAEYLDILKRASKGDFDLDSLHAGLGTPETPVFLGMYEYASLAVGASLKAAELILSGEVKIAFNPSGGYHHAHPSRAGGFCYLNDVVLASMALADAGRRVLILDIDAHHCDGVQDAFYDRPDILTLSLHEYGEGFFPGTGGVDEVGVGKGKGYSVNMPLPPGADDRAFAQAFEAIAMPVIKGFAPDVIVLELGMDCLSADPLTHLTLTNNAYADAIQRVADMGLPVLAVGGGGYHVENCVRGWALAWSILTGQDDDSEDLSLGLGGVMLGSTDWKGGLRDRILTTDDTQRHADVRATVSKTIEEVTTTAFPLIGLKS